MTYIFSNNISDNILKDYRDNFENNFWENFRTVSWTFLVMISGRSLRTISGQLLGHFYSICHLLLSLCDWKKFQSCFLKDVTSFRLLLTFDGHFFPPQTQSYIPIPSAVKTQVKILTFCSWADWAVMAEISTILVKGFFLLLIFFLIFSWSKQIKIRVSVHCRQRDMT